MSNYLKLFLGCFLLIQACSSGNDSNPLLSNNIYSDAELQQLYTYQDLRQTDSLIPYLTHEKALYREKAALAFASVQDSLAMPHLTKALADTSQAVVRGSAYALGQLSSPKALKPLMAVANDKEATPQSLFYALEAIGKCADDSALTFLNSYSLSRCPEGVAAGLYRALLKRQSSGKSLNTIAALTKREFNDKTRLFAAAYLARQQLDLTPLTDRLIHTLKNDGNAYVRMNSALALSKSSSSKVPEALEEAFNRDESHLVRINVLKAMQSLKIPKALQYALKGVTDLNPQVAITAAQTVNLLATADDASAIATAISSATRWRVKATLLKALLRIDDTKASIVLEELKKSNNPYERAALLSSLSANPQNYTYLKERLYSADHPALKTAAIEALVQIRNSEQFEKYAQSNTAIKKEFAEIFQYAIESKDIALVYFAAIELRNPKHNYLQYYKNTDFLDITLKALELPKDIEAYQEVQKTIDFLRGEKSDPIQKSIEHPINWEAVSQIPDRQRVKINTAKGNIVMELMVNQAPGTVSTIVGLIKQGFYNGKTFHRIVPNFVAQGGCPRGDGFGGLPYTIRSEFAPLYYEAGSVGVASAGKDTESCQWFITHSPTPHLDGRYTIFAKVVKGMDVVQQLEIGDIIEHASLEP